MAGLTQEQLGSLKKQFQASRDFGGPRWPGAELGQVIREIEDAASQAGGGSVLDRFAAMAKARRAAMPNPLAEGTGQGKL
jgi:hypothetical protein